MAERPDALWSFRWPAVLMTIVAVALTARFWRSILAPGRPSDLVIDWSMPIYGLLGVLTSMIALRLVNAAGGSLTVIERRSLRVIGLLCASGYIACMSVFFWRSLR